MRIYLTGAAEELPELPPGLGCALVDPPPEGTAAQVFPGRDKVLLLGGELRPDRASAIAAACRRQGFSAVLSGFGRPSALDVLRFCDLLLRQGIKPILPEESWVSGCGGEMLISSAVSGGTLEERLREALGRTKELAVDLERLRRRFPLPCPDGRGEPVSPEELEGLLRSGREGRFSRELMCRAFPLEEAGTTSFLLYDDRETLREKTLLAAALGIRRGFLLWPEWGTEDAAAALEAAEQGKSPAIQR